MDHLALKLGSMRTISWRISEPSPTARRKRLRIVVPGVTSLGSGMKARIAFAFGSMLEVKIELPAASLGKFTPVKGFFIVPAKIPLRWSIVGTVPTAVFTVRVFFHSCE